MANKNPFDFTEMMSMFDPAKVAKMFDPTQLGESLNAKRFEQFDFSQVLENNQANYDSMLAANQAAAAIYKSFYEKQMTIFTDVMNEAAEQAKALQAEGGPDLEKKQREIYNQGLERSFKLMTDLANATQQAQEESFALIMEQVADVVNNLKPK